MGIKDFYKHLKTKCPECFVPVDYSMFTYQRIALDMMNILYTHKARDERQWMKNVIEFIAHLRQLGVHPVCVFDGHSHPLKQKTVEKRRTEREKGKDRVQALLQALDEYKQDRVINAYFTQFLESKPEYMSKLTRRPILSQIEDYARRQQKNYSLHFRTVEVDALKQILQAMGVIVLTADHDGEALCSYLSAKGWVEAVISNDSDVFFFGCQQVIFRFTDQGGYLIQFRKILEHLDLTQEQFMDLCLLCGTDFNSSIRGVGFCRALALIQKYRSLDHPEFPHRNQLDYSLLNQIREMSSQIQLEPLGYCREVDSEQLELLLFQQQINVSQPLSWNTEIILWT